MGPSENEGIHERSDRKDSHFSFAYLGLAICMLGTIYVAALSPGNTLSDLALMSVFP
jgi:hypothetical protein